MSAYKKWAVWVLGALAFLLCCAVALVVVVDPFFHYHAPLEGISWQLTNDYYQNDGIVRHFEYDTLVTGSSMSENIKTSWVEELYGGAAVKACFSGATSRNNAMLLSTALRENKDLKRVFWGLDVFMMEMDPDQVWDQLPTYLYDDDPFNDVRYVLNKSVVDTCIDELRDTARGSVRNQSFDDYSFWAARATFGEAETLKTFEPYWDPAVYNDYMRAPTMNMDWVRRNLDENILPLIDGHPDVTFEISIPPYSVLFWQARMARGELEATMEMLRTVIPQLLARPNVKLYSFLDWEAVTTDLGNYMDPIHHTAEVNYQMLSLMAADEHRLTSDNYQNELDAVYETMTHFDYDVYRP